MNSTRTHPKEATTDAPSTTINHYVPKREITESIVMGTKVTALCGFRYVVTARGGGSAGDGKAKVCSTCADHYNGMQDRD